MIVINNYYLFAMIIDYRIMYSIIYAITFVYLCLLVKYLKY